MFNPYRLKLIDIWKPIGDKTKGCYKTKITVI